MPATGVRPPFLTLVAVRAIAPVAGMPPKSGVHDVGDALRDQLHVRAVPAADHAVGDDRREQRLDRAEQRDGERRRRRATQLRQRDVRQRRVRAARRMPPNRDADRLDRPGASSCDHGGRDDQRDERPGNAPADPRPEPR